MDELQIFLTSITQRAQELYVDGCCVWYNLGNGLWVELHGEPGSLEVVSSVIEDGNETPPR